MKSLVSLVILALAVLGVSVLVLWNSDPSAPQERETALRNERLEEDAPSRAEGLVAPNGSPAPSVERSAEPEVPVSSAPEVVPVEATPQLALLASGRVVTLDGVSIAGAVVFFPTGHCLSDHEGRFEVRASLPAGTYALQALAGGHLVSGQQVALPTKQELLFQLGPARTIEGFVLDAGGAPIEGVRIFADASTMPRFADSDAKGHFVLADPLGDQDATKLHVLQGVTEAWRSPEKITWGSKDHVLTLVPTLGFEIEVVDRASGEAIENYAVHCLPPSERPSDKSLRNAGRHENGKLLITGVPKGDRKLWVVPEDPRYAPHERQEVFVRDGTPAQVRIELEARPALQIEVVSAAGAPIAGASVDLIRSSWRRDLILMDVVRLDDSGLLRSGEGYAGLLDQQTSDATGRVTLRTVPDRPQLTLPRAKLPPEVHPALFVRCSAKGHAPILVPAPFAEAVGAALRIVMPPSATLVAKVEPSAILEFKPVLWLAPVDYDAGLATSLPPFALPLVADDKGGFTATDLAAGDYDLRVFIERFKSDAFAMHCTLRGSETVQIVVDLQRMVPGRVDAIVEDAPEGWMLTFRTKVTVNRSSLTMDRGAQDLDAGGAVKDLIAYPGLYDVVLEPRHLIPMGEGPRGVWLGRENILPGERHSFRFTYSTRRLKLRFRLADGSIPPTGTQVEITEATASYVAKTDDAGECLVMPSPRTKFHLTTRAVQYPREDEFEAPPGKEDWQLDVELRR